MFHKVKTFYCPICKTKLGTFSAVSIIIADCPDEDCKVKWCFKPNVDLPTALDYPGIKKSKKCTCPSCTK